MTNRSGIELEGDATLRATLISADKDLQDLDQIDNARIVEQRARAAAPKKTGTLSRSIRAKDAGMGRAEIASDLIYAPVIHYGWHAHNIQPNHFLTEALSNSQPVIEANNLREANKILDKVKGA